MFDTELDRIYSDIQYKLKSKSEESLKDIEAEISSIRNKIIDRLDSVLSYNRIPFDRYKLETIADEYLVAGLKNSNKKTLVNNFQRLSSLNSAIQNSLLEQAKQQVSKEIKEKNIAEFLQKYDYTMSEYKKQGLTINRVDLKETFNDFFHKFLKNTPLYNEPMIVEEIKQFLQQELKATQDFFIQKRNNIITSNTTLLVEGTNHLAINTNLSSKVSSETIQEIKPKMDEVVERRQHQINENVARTQVNDGLNNQVEVPVQKQPTETVDYIDKSNTTTATIEQPINSIPVQEQPTETVDYMNKSNTTATIEQPINSVPVQTVPKQEQEYRILDDGTIEWNRDPRTNMFTQEEIEHFQRQNPAPSSLDNEKRIVSAVKQQLNNHVWQDIGVYAARTDETIDFVSNEILNEVNSVLQKYGIPNNPNTTFGIISQLNSEIKEVNNVLSTNMVKTFTKVNEATIDSVSETFSKPTEIQEQDVEQCLDVYMQTTQLKGFHLNCSKQFETATMQICNLYGINANTPQYREIKRIVEDRKIQVESQMHNMFNDFSNSNAINMRNVVGATMLSQKFVRDSQQDYSMQQIQALISYNVKELDKIHYEQMMEQQLGQTNSGMSR